MKDFFNKHKALKWIVIILILLIFFAGLIALPNLLIRWHAPWTVKIKSDHDSAWLSYLGNFFGAFFSATIAGVFAYFIMNKQLDKENQSKVLNKIIDDLLEQIRIFRKDLLQIQKKISSLDTDLFFCYFEKIDLNKLSSEALASINKDLKKHLASVSSFITSYSTWLNWIDKCIHNKVTLNTIENDIKNITFNCDSYKNLSDMNCEIKSNDLKKLNSSIDEVVKALGVYEKAIINHFYDNSF